MASRYERYHDRAVNENKRTVKNKDLYDNIYQESEAYSNIEGVVEPSITNEIDISKVKELLAKQKRDEEIRLVKKDFEVPNVLIEETNEDNYDIKEALAQAKEDVEVDHKIRKLDGIDFEGIKKRINNKDIYTEEEQKRDIADLQELIETIAGNNKSLNGLADKDLSLDMFSDLAKTTELTDKQGTSIKKVIAEARANEIDENRTEEVEKIFNTGSMKLKDKDFTEDGEDVKVKMPLFLKIILILIAIIILIIFVIVGYEAISGAINK